MIQGAFITDKKELLLIEDIFNKVFISDKQGDSFISEAYTNVDNYELTTCFDIYILAYEGLDKTQPVGAGRMSISMDEPQAKLMQIAILEEYRGKKYGDFLVRMLIDKAKRAGIGAITVDSPHETINFFRRLGFKNNGNINSESDRIPMIYDANSAKSPCETTKNA